MSEDAKAALLEKLRALRRQEEEAKVLVQSIDISLVEMGFDTDIIKTGKQQQHSRTGISINNQLSFRGKQKAEEQFDMLDLDNDGQLNYEDFLGQL